MKIKFYQVGGSVRDELMGLKSNDIDYAVEAPSFEHMRQAIIDRGGEIFLETPRYFTIRAKVPQLGCTDYVLCRKDGGYSDGRRPDEVCAGTLLDDLSRRDFTINAIAKGEDGEIFDPFDGQIDIQRRIIRCVGDTKERFKEDSLRLVRAFRFAMTKNFSISGDIRECLRCGYILSGLKNVSAERIREELTKCFAHDSLGTLRLFHSFPEFMELVINNENGIWLKPTTEKK